MGIVWDLYGFGFSSYELRELRITSTENGAFYLHFCSQRTELADARQHTGVMMEC